MKMRLIFILTLATHVTAESGDDFSNNLFSDLAPLLALFGERVTTQFMSQAIGWADNFILAMAPLGIITIVVSAIRVGGPSWLKALIGRARENIAAAEAELMSSTSEEVCELWNGREVVRCMGSAPICEFICLSPKGGGAISTGEPHGDAGTNGTKSHQNVEIMKIGKTEKFLRRERKNDSSPKEPSSSQAEKGQASIGRLSDIVVTRIDIPAPNISLNSHRQRGRGELHAGAVFGTILQLGVLVYSALATYLPSLKFPEDNHPVAGYAFPFFCGGTLVLVSSLLICAHVVESSTEEERYRAQDGSIARLVWLQQPKTVSDQVFESFAIFPYDARTLITTSSRAGRKENQTSSHDKTAGTTMHEGRTALTVALEFKTVLGTMVGLCGFVAQFIGLRGLHWSTSIAQLGAVLVMTAIRAAVRRGLATPPKCKPLTAGFELEWFAMTLGQPYNAPWWNASKPETNLFHDWRIVTGESPDVYHKLREENDDNTNSEAHRVMIIRRNLSSLSGWPSPVSAEAIALTRAIEITMDTLIKSTGSSYTWSLQVNYAQSKTQEHTQSVDFRLKRQNEKWKAHPGEIEAALALWLYSVQKQEQNEVPQAQVKQGCEEDEWLGAKSSRANRGLRLLGSYTLALERDLDWWMPPNLVRILELQEAEDGDLQVDYRSIVGSGRKPEGKSAEPNTSGTSQQQPRSYRVLKPSDKHDNALLAAESDIPFKLLYAQDMFTALVWAVAKTLSHPIEGDSDIQLNNRTSIDAWTSFTLRNDQLSGMALDIHSTGLGSLEEVYLCIIPALSIERKLPAPDKIVEMAREHAKPHERVQHWELARNVYLWLFETARTYRSGSEIATKATAVLMEYLRMITLTLEWTEAQRFENRTIETMKEVKSSIEEKLTNADQKSLLSFMGLYKLQGREWKCESVRGNGDVVKNDTTDAVRCGSRKLHLLVQSKNWNVEKEIKKALRHGETVNQKDVHDWTPLHYAAADGQVQAAAALLKHQADVNARDLCDWTPLHYACKNGDSLIVRNLLQEGAEIDARGTDGVAPIHCAAMENHVYIVQLLTEAGAAVDMLDSWGNTPLHWAAFMGHKAVVEYLWEDANKKLRDSNGRTALHLAVVAGKSEVVEWLASTTQVRSVMEAKDGEARTPLHIGAEAGHGAVVQALLANGANVDERCRRGQMALNISRIPVLLVNGKAVAESSSGQTPLHISAEAGHETVVRALLVNGADIEAKDDSGWTPLHLAAGRSHEVVARLLLENGANIEAKDDFGWTPLHRAVDEDHEAVAGLLLGTGADVNAKDSSSWTPLHRAASKGCKAVGQLLLEKGAETDAIDGHGRTPLHLAADGGYEAVARLLLEKGADLEAMDGFEFTPLHLAANRGHEAVIQLLVQKGADTDAVAKTYYN